MSAIAESVKFRFVGLWKQLRRRLNGTPLEPAAPPAAPAAAPALATRTTATPARAVSPVPTTVGPKPAVGNQICIPLCTIVSTLPLELRARVKAADTTGLLFPVAVEDILPQLAGGVVKVTFGQLRQALPQAFTPGNSCDEVQVVLPLSEILPRLNPALLPRRTHQKQLTVPSHVTGPFEHGARGVTFSVGKPQPEPATAQPAGAPAPVASAFAPGATAPAARPAPTPSTAPPATSRIAHAVSPAASPSTPKVAPRPGVQVSEDVPAEIFRRAPAVEQPASPQPASPRPASPALSPAPSPLAAKPSAGSPAPARPLEPVRPAVSTPIAGRSAPSARPHDAPAATQNGLHPAAAKPPAPATFPSVDEPTLLVDLSAVLGTWPEGLRQEIVTLNLATARLALPLALVETGLRQGRAVFSWKVLRSYLQPAPPPSPSAFEAAELELPLNVLAPLFIAHKKAQAAPKRRLTVDETIPNLFSAAPTHESPPASSPQITEPIAERVAEAAPAPPATPPPPAPRENKVVDTNYYVWDDVNETARVDETEFKRRPASGGTDFIVKYATPNEIVSRAAALEGVAGALIALPDGLMVASRIPSDLNGDTLAAFLPQIFAKVSQCTRELRMGELNNLAFTVGNVPWKIFRVNAIFFAAFGRQGEALPTAPLAALAAELDRRQR
ncbi:MAG: hypothetical protein RMK20_12335 [Verrucomicrobiales bacterium]|nr:hypothetical protein [Verrucomicrobiales bacterium]